MKSKKLAALGLTAVLSLGLLTACSGGSDDTNETPAGSTPPVTESGVPAADSPANWTSADALATAKIAVQEGTTGDALVSDTYPDATVSRFKAVTACGMELLNGRVDCVVVDSLPAQKLVEANADKMMILPFAASDTKEAYAIGLPKGSELTEEFNAAMETLNENGTYDLLVQKHISNEDVELPELPSYESKGTLTMGTNAEFEPFEYVGDDGETLMGFDIDYAKYLCATMGYDLEIENMDFDALPGALQSGKVDFLAAGISITEEKQQVMDFTNEYYEATQAIVVLK